MSFAVYIVFTTLLLHGAHSYIMITANLDDLHSIIKEIAESPMSDQIGHILRRAYNQFGHDRVQDLIKRSGLFQMRTDETLDGPEASRVASEESRRMEHASPRDGTKDAGGHGINRRKLSEDTVDTSSPSTALKEADYLKSINKVFENV